MRKPAIMENTSWSGARFLFILFSLCIFLPMPIASIIFGSTLKGPGAYNTGPLLFISALFIILEFIEYKKFQYNVNKIIAYLGFTFRLGMWLILNIYYGFANPLSFILTPLITLYAYFTFSQKISNIFCGLLIILEIFINIFSNTQPILEQNNLLVTTFFLVAKIAFIIFFQVYARLLERDKRIQATNDRLLENLKKSHAQLQAYATQIADHVAIEERNKLARDIHDSLGHYLTAIRIQLSKAEAFFERDRNEALQALLEAKSAASEAIEDVRESVQALNQDEYFNFKVTIDAIIERIDKDSYTVEYSSNGDPSHFNYSVLITLYRVIQEGITNIFKHSQADHIKLLLDFKENEVIVCLKDNGIGFDYMAVYEKGPAGKPGFGLHSIRERIELIQGSFRIASTPGNGTEITVVAPRDPVKSFIGNTL